MEFSQTDLKVLRHASRHDERAYVRTKALALLSAAAGRTYTAIGPIFDCHRESVGRWVKRFAKEGIASIYVAPGRGRKGQADVQELAVYLRQSPRRFGIARTRWTLRLLAETVPSLRGMSDAGVYRTLQRAGFRYKRGQPAVHSPDPEYGEKRGGWTRPSARRTPGPRTSSSSSKTKRASTGSRRRRGSGVGSAAGSRSSPTAIGRTR